MDSIINYFLSIFALSPLTLLKCKVKNLIKYITELFRWILLKKFIYIATNVNVWARLNEELRIFNRFWQKKLIEPNLNMWWILESEEIWLHSSSRVNK